MLPCIQWYGKFRLVYLSNNDITRFKITLPDFIVEVVERRREGDLNSRVQGTVDFESTAIPGYAISADKPPTCTTIIRVMSLG